MKKLKIGTKVKVKPSYFTWLEKNILSLYRRGNNKKLEKDDSLLDLVIYSYRKKYPLKSKIIGYGINCYYVEISSDLGTTSTYLDEKDFILLNKK